MTKKLLFPDVIIDVGRRFDACGLPEIQAAFAAAVAATNDPKEQGVFNFVLDCAVGAKNNDPEALGNLAAVFGAAGHLDIAMPMFENACGIDTDRPLLCRLRNRVGLGDTYSEAGRLSEALASYEKAIEIWERRLDTQGALVFLNHVVDDVVNSEIYRALLAEACSGIFYTAGQIGTDLCDQGKDNEALPYLQKAVHYKRYASPTDGAHP